ncbi:hypothetical protein DFQ28_009222 [Apophysomyces sp. BC1034]|nr:hypothetical protein DFQ29_007907 [Apophysomyces sp. BC1021]KAG0185507.1 hypothetical protein DFQ28_009222 [Apophysomyces sp. BC1034]
MKQKERPESHTTQKDQPATADQSLSAQVTEDTPPPPVPPKDWVVKEQSTKRDALVNRFFNRKSTADPPATAKSVSPFLTRRLTSIVQRYSKKEKGKEPAINARNTREKRHAASEVYTTYPPTGGPTVQAIA